MVLAAASCGIVLLTHGSTRSNNPIEKLPLATRLANASVSYAIYLGQSFFPANLTLFYPHPGTRLPLRRVASALILLVAITAVAAYFWRRRPYLLVGWLWFLGMLVPVIGLMQIGAHSRADRYNYLSQIGLSIALAWGVWSIYRSKQSRRAESWRGWMLAALSGGAVLRLPSLPGVKRPTGKMPRRFGRMRSHATNRTRWPTITSPRLYNLQGKTERRSPISTKRGDWVDRSATDRQRPRFAGRLPDQARESRRGLSHLEEAVLLFPTAPVSRAVGNSCCRGQTRAVYCRVA